MKILLNNEVARRLSNILSNMTAEFVTLSYGTKLNKDGTFYMHVQAISPTEMIVEPVTVELKAGKEEEIPETEKVYVDNKTFTKLINAVCSYDEKIVLSIADKQVSISTVKGQASVKLGRLENRDTDVKSINIKEMFIRATVRENDLDQMLSRAALRGSEHKDKSISVSFRVPEKRICAYGANDAGNSFVRKSIEAKFPEKDEETLKELRAKACEGSKLSSADDYRVTLATSEIPLIKEYIRGAKNVQVFVDKTHLVIRGSIGYLSIVLHSKEWLAFKVIDAIVDSDPEVVWQFDAGEVDKALNLLNISQTGESNKKPPRFMVKANKATFVLPDNQGAKVDVKAQKGDTEKELFVNPIILKKAILEKGNLLISLVNIRKGSGFIVSGGTLEEPNTDTVELVMLCSFDNDKSDTTTKTEAPKKEEKTPAEEESQEVTSEEAEVEETVEDIDETEYETEDYSDEDIPFEE